MRFEVIAGKDGGKVDIAQLQFDLARATGEVINLQEIAPDRAATLMTATGVVVGYVDLISGQALLFVEEEDEGEGGDE